MSTDKPVNLLALDVGDVRIGVALATYPTFLPQALITLSNDQYFIDKLKDLIDVHHISRLIVGLPRNMDSEDTPQTLKVKNFVNQIKSKLQLEIIFQDEFLTSKKAQEILEQRSKSYSKEDIDKTAASLILEDYINGDIK